jgi:hypothetical protein
LLATAGALLRDGKTIAAVALALAGPAPALLMLAPASS